MRHRYDVSDNHLLRPHRSNRFFAGFKSGEYFGYLDGVAHGRQEERLRALQGFLEENCPRSPEPKK